VPLEAANSHALGTVYSPRIGLADIEVPNRTVAMDAWVRSACYPRRTFYPLSDDPSIRDHRITMTDFRLCLSRRSCSQAGFCHCTHHPISDRIEPTIARLRYSLGGDRPSQTAYHTWARTQCWVAGRHQEHKGWYFTLRLHES